MTPPRPTRLAWLGALGLAACPPARPTLEAAPRPAPLQASGARRGEASATARADVEATRAPPVRAEPKAPREPPDPGRGAAPTPPGEREPQAPARAAPGLDPELLGAPWSLDRRGFRPPRVPDALTVHGWSRDGLRFAFEVAAPGEGTRCGARRWLRVVDAERDRFLAREDVAFSEPERDDCDPSALEAKMAPLRATALARHGIEPGHLLAPARLRADGEAWVARWPEGQVARFRLEERFATDDVYGEAAERGAAYLLVRSDESRPQVLEDGARRRAGVIGYRLDPGFLLTAPSGPGYAVLISRLERAFEGARWSWMANGALR